jgi:uncharacterized membrane protein YfcA
LAEVGLPQKAIPLALLFFNLGVEVGQVTFITGIFFISYVAYKVVRRIRIRHPSWSWRFAPYTIGAVAAFWFIQRLSTFP